VYVAHNSDGHIFFKISLPLILAVSTFSKISCR
jgi:hypothetical protein